MNLPDACQLARAARKAAQRFLADPAPVTAFGMLDFDIGYVCPHDDSMLDVVRKVMTRQQAAEALRAARQQRECIDRTPTGYSVSGALNPTWRYEL